MAATTNPALSPATQEQLKWQHAAKWVRGRKRETPTTVSRGTVDWAAARLVRQLKLRWLFLVHSAHLTTMSTLKKSRQVDFAEINEGLTSFVTDLSKLKTVLYFQPRFRADIEQNVAVYVSFESLNFRKIQKTKHNERKAMLLIERMQLYRKHFCKISLFWIHCDPSYNIMDHFLNSSPRSLASCHFILQIMGCSLAQWGRALAEYHWIFCSVASKM